MSKSRSEYVDYDKLAGPITGMANENIAESVVDRAEEIYEEESITGRALASKAIGFLVTGEPTVYKHLEDTRYVQRRTPRLVKSQKILEKAADDILEQNSELNEGFLEE